MRRRSLPPAAFPAMLLAGSLGLIPGAVQAQSGCNLAQSNFTSSLEVGGGNRITYVSGPLLLACDDGTRIRADSAQQHSATAFSQLFGNVFFENPEKAMVAEMAHYFERESRLVAWGDVVLTDKVNQSVLRGDSLLYLSAGARRAEDYLTVSGGRAHGTLYPGESQVGEDPDVPAPGDVVPQDAAPRDTAPQDAAPQDAAPRDTISEPYEIDADRIILEGDRLFRAIGTVEIRREELEAYADTAEYDQVDMNFLLFGNARMAGENYDLVGRRITLRAPDDELRDVVASGDALLTSEDIVLTSPEIRIFLTEGQMERLVAVMLPEDSPLRAPGAGAVAERADADADTALAADVERDVRADAEAVAEIPGQGSGAGRAASGRPQAVTEDFMLVGDSLEVQAPGERLESVVASGRARGESLAADTANQEGIPEFARRDWLEGDTIIALFIPDSADADVESEVVAELDDPGAVAPDTTDAAGATNAADTVGVDDSPGFVLERLIARGDARSLYRLEPSDANGEVQPGDTAATADPARRADAEPADARAAADPPENADAAAQAARTPAAPRRMALHYVRGTEITILMLNGEIDRMEVEGPTDGVHLEPTRGQAAGTTGAPAGANGVAGPPPGGLQ